MRLAVLAVTTVLAVPAAASSDVLSDSDLVARANDIFSKQQSPADRIIGIHKGQQVILDQRCGDICPNYTVRIIHYVIPDGAACTAMGADKAAIAVPMSIAVINQDFCVPHVLYVRKLYTDHPFRK